MFVLSTPEQSEAILEELCQIEEEIFQELGLSYKVLVSSMFSLGGHDTQAWHASNDVWLSEILSV